MTGLNFYLLFLNIGIFFDNVKASLTGEGIVGGDLAVEDQFPYHAFLYFSTSLDYQCSAAIISKDHVITAAHCIVDRYGFFERLLKVKVGVINAMEVTREYSVDRIYIPWQYTPKGQTRKFNLTCDIAVLKLSESLDLGTDSKLKKVKLPEKVVMWINSTEKLEWSYPTYTEEIAVMSGYGFNTMKVIRNDNGKNEEHGTTDYRLRYAESKVLPHEDCLKKTNTSSMNVLCAQMIRPEKIHKGTCSADSGGPLVFNNTLIGILVASPFGCTEKYRPARYTRVAEFMPFIENAINEIDVSEMRVAEFDMTQYKMVRDSVNSKMAKKSWIPDE